MSRRLPTLRGRGASWNPPNRFERLHVERSAWTDPDDPIECADSPSYCL